jgi:Mn2+/Fe2+ NRAMP family transporter
MSAMVKSGLVQCRIGPPYWSAVINGVVAVPVMIVLMHMTANPKVMGKFRVSDGLRVIGWISTSVMFFATLAMVAAALYA